MKIFITYHTPTRQLVDIKLQFKTTQPTTLQLPAWRPGRYEIANYAQYIYPLILTKGIGTIKKINKDCWQLNATGEVEISYQFYAARMDAGSSWLDEEQLYLNFINCIPKVEALEHEPIEIIFSLPDAYRLVSSLKTQHHTLYADSYSELVDSPVIASSSVKSLKYQVGETTFHIQIQGNWVPDETQLLTDFKRFTQAQVDFFGGSFPSTDYHFLIQALPYKHYHGVEHQNSTVITLGPDKNLNSAELYKELLGVSSHELFHAWNVTRIRPKEMVPYDFSTETYHTTGFITEGLTTYYGDLMLYKSGVFSLEEYLNEVNNLLKKHFQNDGRKTSTLIESSMDLWLDGYKLGAPHRKVSIYNEGALCALLLDLKIIIESNGKYSLQNVMLDLWREFGDTQKGYSTSDYLQIIEKYIDGETYLENYIFGNTSIEIELKELLSKVGFELKKQESSDELERLYGLKTIVRNDKKEIYHIAKNSEAEKKLMLGDIIEKQEKNLFGIVRNGKSVQIQINSNENHLGFYQINKIRENKSLWI